MARNHWNCTKFADKLRGTAKPSAATGKGWNEWEEKAKAAFPKRYWLAETALDNIQDVIMWPIDRVYDVKYYILNRWVTPSHAFIASKDDVKRGQWCDVSHRMLPCLFGELVEFVEVELAWSNICWNEEAREKFKAPWYASGWWRLRTWRSKEAGLECLNWQSKLTMGEHTDEEDLTPTPQAEAAMEILALYKWWTEDRPNRPDAYDESGWTEHCEKREEKLGDGWLIGTDDNREETNAALDKLHEIEKLYEDEDTEMMCRLVKVRGALWT